MLIYFFYEIMRSLIYLPNTLHGLWNPPHVYGVLALVFGSLVTAFVAATGSLILAVLLALDHHYASRTFRTIWVRQLLLFLGRLPPLVLGLLLVVSVLPILHLLAPYSFGLGLLLVSLGFVLLNLPFSYESLTTQMLATDEGILQAFWALGFTNTANWLLFRQILRPIFFDLWRVALWRSVSEATLAVLLAGNRPQVSFHFLAPMSTVASEFLVSGPQAPPHSLWLHALYLALLYVWLILMLTDGKWVTKKG